MTIDAIISETRAMPIEERAAALEKALRHYYFKSMRLEQPLTLAVRGDRIVAVPNRIGLGIVRRRHFAQATVGGLVIAEAVQQSTSATKKYNQMHEGEDNERNTGTHRNPSR